MPPIAVAGSRKLLERFTCAICLDVQEIRSLRELACCSSLLCEACSKEHFGQARRATCPCCRKRKPGEPQPLPTLYTRLADDVSVLCDAPDCDWSGSLNDYFREHGRRCSAAAEPCRHGCGALVPYSDRAAHDRSCERNASPCSLCGELLRLSDVAEHEAEAAPRHVEILRGRLLASEARESAVAAAVAAASVELAELRSSSRATAAALEAAAQATESAAAHRFAWVLSPPSAEDRARAARDEGTGAAAEEAEEAEEAEGAETSRRAAVASLAGWAFETQPWCTAAGVSLWLRLEASQDGREAEVRLHADAPLLLKHVAAAVASSPGSGWRSCEQPEPDVVLSEPAAPRLDETVDEEADEEEASVRAALPLATWRLHPDAASSNVPRCVVDICARSLLLF